MSANLGSESQSLRAHYRQSRLEFPPSYVLVGIYRLVTDRSLHVPVWQKCKHGLVRGAVVGLIWALFTFRIQNAVVERFLAKSPRVTGLSTDSIYGFKLPFTITTYATIVFISSQVETIIRFCLSKNIRIARDRAWDQTIESRGKGPDFWQPYVEEWQQPPVLGKEIKWHVWLSSWVFRRFIQPIILMPVKFYPFVGLGIVAYIKALGTARYLHRPYFARKKMNKSQSAIFIEERKHDYRAFGFTAALAESIPFLGLLFTVSNRIGAAMWAHDLEKRQHMFRTGELRPQPRPKPVEVYEPGYETPGSLRQKNQ